MLFNQRVIYSDHGVLSDLSQDLNDFRAGSALFPYVAGEDYLYIGTFLPFNHRYIDLSVVNSLPCEVSLEIWDGQTFNAAIDLLDQTRLGQVSCAQNGFMRWSTSRTKVWHRELDSFDIPGLEDTNISNFFWVRLSWDQSFDPITELKFIGQKFSKDLQLFSYFPDLNNTTLMEAFSTGKTSWEEQHYIAAEQIVRELIKRNYIYSGDQLLDYELFLEPSVYKTAELIYSGLGQAYEDKRNAAQGKYISSLDQGYLRIDKDGDGNLSTYERVQRTGFLKR